MRETLTAADLHRTAEAFDVEVWKMCKLFGPIEVVAGGATIEWLAEGHTYPYDSMRQSYWATLDGTQIQRLSDHQSQDILTEFKSHRVSILIAAQQYSIWQDPSDAPAYESMTNELVGSLLNPSGPSYSPDAEQFYAWVLQQQQDCENTANFVGLIAWRAAGAMAMSHVNLHQRLTPGRLAISARQC